MHAYTAIVLFASVVVVCLFLSIVKLRKTEGTVNEYTAKRAQTKPTKAQSNKKKAGSAKNICAMKRLLNTETYKMTFSPHFPPFRLR